MTDSDPNPESNTAIDLLWVINYEFISAIPIYIMIEPVNQSLGLVHILLNNS